MREINSKKIQYPNMPRIFYFDLKGHTEVQLNDLILNSDSGFNYSLRAIHRDLNLNTNIILRSGTIWGDPEKLFTYCYLEGIKFDPNDWILAIEIDPHFGEGRCELIYEY